MNFSMPSKSVAARYSVPLMVMQSRKSSCRFMRKIVQFSKSILHDKLENIEDNQADIAAVACPACMMQIGGGLNQQNPRIKVKHVADILAECVAER